MTSKKYKKGFADASKAYEDFGQKQTDAINFILNEVRQGKKSLEEAMSELKGDLNHLCDFLKSNEKAKLYTVYTPFDIKDLEQEGKLFLAGVLFALTMNCPPNENQQNYYRAVLRYLDLREPPMNVDPMAIENIDSSASQKAIFQVVLEYLCLQDGDSYAETPLQECFLDAFNINDKNRQVIIEHVEKLYQATGAKGLAEKYGYIPTEDEADSSTESEQDVPPASSEGETRKERTIPDVSDFEEIKISHIMHIKQGEVCRYQYKIIHFGAPIECEGSLEFDCCVLHYGESEIADEIKLTGAATVSMTHCTVENHSFDEKFFLDISSDDTALPASFDSCTFINCSYFLNTNNVFSFKNCEMKNIGDRFIYGPRGWAAKEKDRSEIYGCNFIFQNRPRFLESEYGKIIEIESDRLHFAECSVTGDRTALSKSREAKKSDILYSYNENFLEADDGLVEHAIFRYMQNCIYRAAEVKLSTFEDCNDILWSGCTDPLTIIEDCRFDNCQMIASGIQENSKISHCQFNDCRETLLRVYYNGGLNIRYCEFNNWKSYPASKARGARLAGGMIELVRAGKSSASHIENCIFNGMQAYQDFVIKAYANEKMNGYVAYVSNCSFLNCTTERSSGKIVQEYSTYFTKAFKTEKSQQVTSISECRGLDHVNCGSGQAENVTKRDVNDDGVPLGLTIAVATAAGVPGLLALGGANARHKASH